MSDSKTVPASKSAALAEFNKKLEEDKNLDKKKKEVQEKRLLVEEYKYTNELERIRKSEEDLKIAKVVNVGVMSDEDIKSVQENSRVYFEGAKNGMVFLHETFRKWVPMWGGNIVLIGARTGGGKSSVAANLIFSTIQQKNPVTGKNRKVLCISAEETPVQVFSRLTCLARNWNFNEQDEFTDEQKEELVDFIPKWAKNGVSVIGEDGRGSTSSIDGISAILDNLLETKTHYDLILIDYIQKITTSKKNPQMQQFMVLKEVMNLLDAFKNSYPGAICVLSQLKANDAEETLDFQDRLRGSKDIITPTTVALELVAEPKMLRSRFIVRKNRYKGSTLGGHVDMGYDRGRFVPYSEEFQKQVADRNESKEYQETVGKHMEDKKKESKEETKE